MIEVVVGIVRDLSGNILISKRQAGTHLAGLWEFPGGKREPNESRFQALQRELAEELGIDVQQAEPLIRIQHHYPERDVLLDVWSVTAYSGVAHGRESQQTRWLAQHALQDYELPAADAPILKALQLPCDYVILNADQLSSLQMIEQLQHNLDAGYRLFQYRSKTQLDQQQSDVLNQLQALAQHASAQLLVNSSCHNNESNACGVHLTTHHLQQRLENQMNSQQLCAASCHNLAELQGAESLGVDFAVLSPVHQTASHPQLKALGWEQFAAWVEEVNIPVYALGGMSALDLAQAKRSGAQGIAGISAYQLLG